MDVSKILASLDEEIAKLQRAKDTIAALHPQPGGPAEQPGSSRPKRSNSTKPKGKRNMTPEGRARIAAAQKARWAKNANKHEHIAVIEEEPVSA